MSGIGRAIGSVIPIAGGLKNVGKTAFAAIGSILGGPIGLSIGVQVGDAVFGTKPTNDRQGQQLQFKIDPGAPIPWVVGRTAVGGVIAHRDTYGKDNIFQSYSVVLSLGPVSQVEAFTADRVVVPFDDLGRASGYYANWMWLDTRRGLTPDTALHNPVGLESHIPVHPTWGVAYKLSGLSSAMWTLYFDTKGQRYASGEPVPGWIVRGAMVYDPRLDSTYPGGSGPCRWASPSDTVAHAEARATWVYSETPALVALAWRLGLWQRDETNPAAKYSRVMGIGAPIELIDVPAIVASANVQEANGWKVGGVIDSAMDKWTALKLIEEAGGAEPLPNAARLSTLQKAPRTSLATITEADLADGKSSVPGMVPRRSRLNGYRARIRSEAHGWEMVDLDIIQVPGYVTADGGEKTSGGDFTLVQQPDQGAALAAYKVFDSREVGRSLQLKPRWIAYRNGDCLTLDLPNLGLVAQDVIVRGRSIDPNTGVVTMQFVTESAGKHAAALGQTGVVPPTPTLAIRSDAVAAPDEADWALTGVSVSAGASTLPGVQLDGAFGNANASEAIVEIRSVTALLAEDGSPLLREDGTVFLAEGSVGPWTASAAMPPATTRRTITDGIAAKGVYQVAVSYRVRGVVGDRLILGPVVAGALAVARACFTVVGYSGSLVITSTATTISISAFTAVLDDARTLDLPAGIITGLTASTSYGLFWQLSTSSYMAVAAPALMPRASSDFVFIRWWWTSDGSGGYPPATPVAPGDGGRGPREFDTL